MNRAIRAVFSRNADTGDEKNPLEVKPEIKTAVTARISTIKADERHRNSRPSTIPDVKDERGQVVIDPVTRAATTNTNRHEWSQFLNCAPNEPVIDGKLLSEFSKKQQEQMCMDSRPRLHGTSQQYYFPIGGKF
jgi:hypothetical protein